MREKEITMLDIAKPDIAVQVQISPDSKTLWVNVDGLCRLRICRISRLDLDDMREPTHRHCTPWEPK